jgi:MFS-type transporter involved in bile tolerance (Atg22 family)
LVVAYDCPKLADLLQALGWGAIAMHHGVSSSVLALTAFLTVTNLGGAISEVMNDAMVVEAGKNKKGGQQGRFTSVVGLGSESRVFAVSLSFQDFFSPFCSRLLVIEV